MAMDPELRARAARELLNHPAAMEVLQELKDHCKNEWEGSGLTDIEAREIAFTKLNALKDVEAILENWSRDIKPKG